MNFDATVDKILHNLISGAFMADENATVSDFLPEAKASLYKAIEEHLLNKLINMAAYDPSGMTPLINPREVEAIRRDLLHKKGE